MSGRARFLAAAVLLGVVLALAFTGPMTVDGGARSQGASASVPQAAPGTGHVVLAWSESGMHWYNRDYEHIAILPPGNTMLAQVIQIGDPPRVVTAGLTVTYEVLSNTFSAGKTNFWDYEQDLYGVDLPPDVGLAGYGLSGTMAVDTGLFTVRLVPVTEYLDADYAANPTETVPTPYQLVRITVHRGAAGEHLAQATIVAPVSSEVRCDYCHEDDGIGNEEIATGNVHLNILAAHDRDYLSDYPAGFEAPLVDSTPVRCSRCHNSNALPYPPVDEEIPCLSRAMHAHHDFDIDPTLDGCYSCHPGDETRGLRGVMLDRHDVDCIDCHGTTMDVAAKEDHWLIQPRCDDAACHPVHGYPADLLYREATDHFGIRCPACHDSPHVEAPSREANDRTKFIALQGRASALRECTVCHASDPEGAGPHGLLGLSELLYLPLVFR